MSPLEYGKEWIQVAFGWKNNFNILREQQYAPTSGYYKPEFKQYDTSISESDVDPYDNTKYESAAELRKKEDMEDQKSGTEKPDTPEVEPSKEEGGSAAIIVVIVLLVVTILGCFMYVKYRKNNCLPLNPFGKTEVYAHAYSNFSEN